MTKISEIEKLIEEISFQRSELKPKFFQTDNDKYSSHDRFLFVKIPELRKIAKKFFDLSLEEIKFFLKSEYNEKRLFALIILVNQYNSKKFPDKKKILEFYIKNIIYVNNWNLVDSSAYQILGSYCFQNQNLIHEIIIQYANDQNDLWKRRISMISMFYFIKNNHFEYPLKIASILVDDKHHLINKAVGWMLREIGKRNIDILVDFLQRNIRKISRISLRYAIEKFSPEERKFFLNLK